MDSKSGAVYLAKFWAKNFDRMEQCREMCRNILTCLGVSDLTRPLVDLGMALTKSKLVHAGMDFDTLRLPVQDTMTPASKRLFLHGILTEMPMGRMAHTLADIKVCKSLCREILAGEHFEVQNAVGFFDNLYQADLVLADLGLILHFFLDAQDKDMILEGQTRIDGHHGLTQIKK